MIKITRPGDILLRAGVERRGPGEPLIGPFFGREGCWPVLW